MVKTTTVSDRLDSRTRSLGVGTLASLIIEVGGVADVTAPRRYQELHLGLLQIPTRGCQGWRQPIPWGHLIPASTRALAEPRFCMSS